MCAMRDASFSSVASSHVSTNFSRSVITLSSCATVVAQDFASKLLNVSLLSPLNFGGSCLFSFASDSVFQKTRWFASWPIEWLPLLSLHEACSAVRPATARLGGTNQSCVLCVVWSCSRRMLRRVTGFLSFSWESADAQ